MITSKNIKFVAYLRLKGFHATKVQKLDRGKALYHFDIPPDTWLDLQKDFDRSQELKYAQCLDAVLDLAF